MPLPRFQRPAADETPAGAYATHYFDAARGDVAALHERIERGFADYSLGETPLSPTADRLDTTIQFLSRSAGIVGLAGALIIVAVSIF
ncbi:MAG TPA: hypothetical protein VF463_21570 [Sphingobium sp.]